MMSRIQITLDSELQRKGRERASQMGISFAEYVRRLVARDLHEEQPEVDPSLVFDLGDSGGSDVARHKDAMIAEAMAARGTTKRKKTRR